MKYLRRICQTVAASGLLLTAVVALGHHGSAGYDLNTRITLTGVITAVELVNPHAFVYIDVKNDKGTVEHWALEGNPPNLLTRLDIVKDLKPGVVISVTGFPQRNDGDQSHLEKALAYSPRALDSLKTAHVLQVGDMKMPGGKTVRYGMGATVESR